MNGARAPRLPAIGALAAESSGCGFFLCVRKEVRAGRSGDFLALTLQDASGTIPAKVFQDVGRLRDEFDAGEFVRVSGRVESFNGRLELLVESIRRVHAEQDGAEGFRVEDCVPSAPRPPAEMWAELQDVIAGVSDGFLQRLLEEITREHEARLRIWPAAQTVHHAYRGGLLEHVLKVVEVVRAVGVAYGASVDLLVTGAILHDIGKLQELEYDLTTSYTREGNLVGHIALGLALVRNAIARIEGFPPGLASRVEHLVVSHHGARDLGSPVEPMTVEAFILSAADALDATLHQVRGHLAGDRSESGAPSYHTRLRRVLYRTDD